MPEYCLVTAPNFEVGRRESRRHLVHLAGHIAQLGHSLLPLLELREDRLSMTPWHSHTDAKVNFRKLVLGGGKAIPCQHQKTDGNGKLRAP